MNCSLPGSFVHGILQASVGVWGRLIKGSYFPGISEQQSVEMAPEGSKGRDHTWVTRSGPEVTGLSPGKSHRTLGIPPSWNGSSSQSALSSKPTRWPLHAEELRDKRGLAMKTRENEWHQVRSKKRGKEEMGPSPRERNESSSTCCQPWERKADKEHLIVISSPEGSQADIRRRRVIRVKGWG